MRRPRAGSAAFERLVEADVRRRIAEEKGPEHVARRTPSGRRSTGLDFTRARRADLEEMRREIHPLARRLATRLTRSSTPAAAGRSTSGAPCAPRSPPAASRWRPTTSRKRPRRTDLVVLCDVSGSVANFAQFTLMLVFALREQFSRVRAFTFVDEVHEVTDHFRPGADPGRHDGRAGRRAPQHATLWGRTNYGRAFPRFAEQYPDALGPRVACSCSATPAPTTATSRCRPCARWRTPPGTPGGSTPSTLRHWDTGDSAAGDVRRARADGRVPQPDPARRVRARPRR